MNGLRRTTTARQERAPHTTIALALTGLALVGLAALGLASKAGAARDPSASAFLQGAVKAGMQQKLRQSLPGLTITRVTCFVPTSSTAIKGPCTAKFTVAKYQLKGTYRVTATLDSQSRLTWATTSRTCTDLRGRRASCTGETNTGNGLISAQLAETQLLRNGIRAGGGSLKVKSAVCTGMKSKRWLRGKFDDVYAQLRCSVRASNGSYSLVFRMAGANGYNLVSVKKTK
jgi:hypothetical protein